MCGNYWERFRLYGAHLKLHDSRTCLFRYDAMFGVVWHMFVARWEDTWRSLSGMQCLPWQILVRLMLKDTKSSELGKNKHHEVLFEIVHYVWKYPTSTPVHPYQRERRVLDAYESGQRH